MPTKEQLQDILERSMPVIRSTSAFILSQVDKVSAADIEIKELNSLVSYVDKEAEKMLVAGLVAIVPNAGFITEENTVAQKTAEYTWVIDPLDGTTNFLNRIPHYCVSVALKHGNDIIVGIVKEVTSGEEWTATLGNGAHLDGSPIRVNSKPFSTVTIATGFPYDNDGDYASKFAVIKHWLTHTNGMRRMGSAALDLCYTACGRFGAYYEGSLNPWDVAAGILIVQEAGGIVTDFSGGQDYQSGVEIVAAAPHLHPEVLAPIRMHLKKLA